MCVAEAAGLTGSGVQGKAAPSGRWHERPADLAGSPAKRQRLTDGLLAGPSAAGPSTDGSLAPAALSQQCQRKQRTAHPGRSEHSWLCFNASANVLHCASCCCHGPFPAAGQRSPYILAVW